MYQGKTIQFRDCLTSPHGRAIPQFTMWLGSESSNRGTNSQPAHTADTVKACTPEIPVLRAQTTPNPGSTATSPQGCPEENNPTGDRLTSPHGRAIPQFTMWLGNEPSNWGTNSQPARTDDTVKTRTPVNSPTRAGYHPSGSTATSHQGCPVFQHIQTIS
ncbi:unnamed protein product [Prunus armeniaca]